MKKQPNKGRSGYKTTTEQHRLFNVDDNFPPHINSTSSGILKEPLFAMQLHHNLSVQQQELIQQLQLVQRQYLIHQGLVKPLHLNLQTQLQNVLSSAPNSLGNSDDIQDVGFINSLQRGQTLGPISESENLKVERCVLEQMHTDVVGLESNYPSNNNNNNNNNSKTPDSSEVKKSELITREIKLEYGTVEHQYSSNELESLPKADKVEENKEQDGADDEDDAAGVDNEEADNEITSKDARDFYKDPATYVSTHHTLSRLQRNVGFMEKTFPSPPWPSSETGINNAYNIDENAEGLRNMVQVSNNKRNIIRKRHEFSKTINPNNLLQSPTDEINTPQMCLYQVPITHYPTCPDDQQQSKRNADTGSFHHQQVIQEFGSKQYYHPLYLHDSKTCRWPGCELALDDVSSFVKHLNTEHCLDDRSTAQARVQMQVVSQLEIHLQKERDRLQAMMHHLYLTKQFLALPSKGSFESRCAGDVQNQCASPTSSPTNMSNALQTQYINQGSSPTPLINSNISTIRKRISDKSPLTLTGGLPYMLERAGLDVQQEIQRNREFYKNADVRPPFTYASLIRQSIIESPDKQLTLNEIYNWFQNTFCYFRRNAATWKNAIRTNLSLHKCFVRYEDDFGSFWMVDDSEFVKRRHLSRGRPRKYEPSSSPNSNSNSQQINNTNNNNNNNSNNSNNNNNNNNCKNNNNINSNNNNNNSNNNNISTNNNKFALASNEESKRKCSKESFSIGNGDNDNGDSDSFDICAGSQRNSSNSNNTHKLKTLSKFHRDTLTSNDDFIHRITNHSGNSANFGVGLIGNIDGYYQNNFQAQNLAHESISSSPTSYRNDNYSPALQSLWPSTFEDAAAALSFNSHNHRHDGLRHLGIALHPQHQQLSQCTSQHEFRIRQQRHNYHEQLLQSHHQQSNFTTINNTFSSQAAFLSQHEKPFNQSDKNESINSKSNVLQEQHQQHTSPEVGDRICDIAFSSENKGKRSPCSMNATPEDLTRSFVGQTRRNEDEKEYKPAKEDESVMSTQETTNE